MNYYNEIKEYTEKIFEDIKHIDENGNEYWSTRELQKYQNIRIGEILTKLQVKQ